MKYERESLGTRLGHTLFPGSHCHTCTVNISLVQYRVHPQLMHPPQKSPLLTLHQQKSPLLIILHQQKSPLAPTLAQLLALLEVELLLVKQLLKVSELIVVHNWVCEVVPNCIVTLVLWFHIRSKATDLHCGICHSPRYIGNSGHHHVLDQSQTLVS